MTHDKGDFPSTIGSGSTDLTTTTGPTTQALVDLKNLVDAAHGFATEAKSPATRKAYRSDWRAFTSWCEPLGVPALPASPETVATYIASMARMGRKVASIERATVAISQGHKMAGYMSPTTAAPVRETLKGIRRTVGVSQDQKAPIFPEQIRAMLAVLPDNLLGVRDCALLLLGFCGGFRRSEIVGLDVADVEFATDGLVITLRRSKTDQEGIGRKVGLPYGSSPEVCPVRSLRRWLDAAGITEGPIFRGVGRWGHVCDERLEDGTVARIVKKHAAALGLDPQKFGGHSLRAGLATAAARAGKSERSIMAQTGHRSVTMVRKYIREGSLFIDNAAAGLL